MFGRALIVTALVLSSCNSDDSTSSSKPPANQARLEAVAGPRDKKAAPPKLRIWRDASTSMDENSLGIALPNIIESIDENGLKLSGVEVVRFGEGNIRVSDAAVHRFDWMQIHVEGEQSSVLPDSAPLARQIFKTNEDRGRQDGERQEQQQLENHRKVIKAVLDQVRGFLAERPTLPAPCTRLTDDLSARIAAEDKSLNVVLTDGWDDCGDKAYTKREMKGRLLVIIFPRKTDTGSQTVLFEQRKQEIKTVFPNAQVVQSFQAASSLDELLHQPSGDEVDATLNRAMLQAGASRSKLR